MDSSRLRRPQTRVREFVRPTCLLSVAAAVLSQDHSVHCPGDEAGVVQHPVVADEVCRNRGQDRGEEEPAEDSADRLRSIRVASIAYGGGSHPAPSSLGVGRSFRLPGLAARADGADEHRPCIEQDDEACVGGGLDVRSEREVIAGDRLRERKRCTPRRGLQVEGASTR